MNICLNTIKLSTSPHLPTRDKLAIAVFSCSTSRAAALVSPVCFQLARCTSAIKEQISKNFEAHDGFVAELNAKKERENISEHSKLSKKGEAASSESAHPNASSGPTSYKKLFHSSIDVLEGLQDEVLLLDDILKVGLTSLNEQAIEMVLAAFVYPLLLEPLLLCVRHTAFVPKAAENEDLGSR